MRRLIFKSILILVVCLFIKNNIQAQVSGDSLIWQTNQLSYDTITSPVGDVYNLGNIDNTDQINLLNIKVIGANDTNQVPAILNNDTIGYLYYYLDGDRWIMNTVTTNNFSVGLNDIIATFKDTSIVPNTLALTVRFTIIDLNNPIPLDLIFTTSILGADTITPIAGVYNLGNISYSDTINSISISVTDFDIDSTNITTTGTFITTAQYNSGNWILPVIPHPYSLGIKVINVVFIDNSGNDTAISITYNIIDNVSPVADTLYYTTAALGLNSITPVADVYNLGNINETDTLISISIKTNDLNIDTNAITSTGSLSIPFVYNGSAWVASVIPAVLPIGNDSLVVIFTDSSNNTTNIKINFTVVDNIFPVAGQLTWNTSIAGNNTINTPTAGVYNLGNISYLDTINSISVAVTDNYLDTNSITTTGTFIATAQYSTGLFNFPVFAHPYSIGIDSINVVFTDNSGNNTPIIIKFNVIDTILPVADTLLFSTTAIGLDTVTAIANVYNLGNINETDTLTSLTLKINDFDIDTNAIITTGSFALPLNYNGSVWVASNFPNTLTFGNDSLVATFKDNSNDSLVVKINFTVIDNTFPVSGQLIWNTSLSGNDTLNTATAGVYDLGNITYFDTLNTITLAVTDNHLDTNAITTTGSYITTAQYSAGLWSFSAFAHPYTVGQNNVIATFTDSSGNNTNITIRFNIIDTILPAADTLFWTTSALGLDTVAPVANVYNLGNINESDTVLNLSIKINDFDINTDTVITTGSFAIPLIYTNSVWVASMPNPLTVGNDSLIAVFKDNSNDSIVVQINFTVIDDILPEGGQLIWNTSLSGNDTIITPTAGVYDLGNITYLDTINSISLLVSDNYLDTNAITTYGSFITTINYNVVTGTWIYPVISHPYSVGQNNINAIFSDNSGNDTTITIRFNVIDSIIPIADTLFWTNSVSGLDTIAVVANEYNLGNINESDTMLNLSIIINDYDIDTNTIYTSGSFSIPLNYNGSVWVASNIPFPLPIGNDSIIAVFNDNSNNNISVKIKFNVIDNIAPKGGQLVWNTVEAGNDSLTSPTTNTYNLGGICITDNFVSLTLTLNESNPDTNKVPLTIATDTIGWMKYNAINNNWICNDTTDFPVFAAGPHSIKAKFWDKAPTPQSVDLTFSFTTGTAPYLNLGQDSAICSDVTLTLHAGTGMDSYLWLSDTTDVTTEVNNINKASMGIGAHTIELTIVKEGCVVKDTIIITINQVPTVNVTPLAVTKCEGIPITLYASGATTYTWNNGASYQAPGDSAVVMPFTTTTYTVTGTTLGCSSTKNSVITIKPSPNINLGPDISMTVDNDIYIGLTTGYTYLWNDSSTTSFQNLHGSDLGIGDTSIWVHVTNTNGCFRNDTIIIHVAHGLVINSVDSKDFVKIYPNPSSGIVNVEIENLNNNNISYEIFDVLGKKVFSKNSDNSSFETVNMTGYSKGIYFVKVNINGKSTTHKLILN